MHSEDGHEELASLRASTENVSSLFSRAGLATRDKGFMSSTPDLSAFTAARDYNQFPSGRKERTRAKESPDSSVSSTFSRKTRDVTFDEGPSPRDRTSKGGRVDFDEILERASRRRRPSAGSVGGESAGVRRSSFSIDRPVAESGQSSYRSVFASEDADLPRVKSSPHVPKQRAERREPGARGFGAPDSAGRGDGYSRQFRGIFNKSRRDSDESDNSGKDTGFSSGRSNSPRDSMPPDSLSGRGGRPGGARPAGRLFDREATISPSRSQRSSSPSKSGSTTPRRQPSPDRRLTPSPTRSVRSSARSAGSPERFGGSRRASAASSVSDAASSRWGRGRGGAGRAQEQPPPEEQALVEAILAQEQEWMRELAEEEEEEPRPASHLRQPPSLPTRDIDSESVTAPELVSDSEADFDRTLQTEFDRMQLYR